MALENRHCEKCGTETQFVRDAYVRITYPTTIVTFYVCQTCANALRESMLSGGREKP